MKKFVVLACAAMVALCLGLSACGGNSKSASEYVGSWNATTASYAGIELDASEVFSDGWLISLESSGTAKMTSDGETLTLKWEETSTGFKVYDSEGTELSFTKVSSGKVNLELEGVVIVFEITK